MTDRVAGRSKEKGRREVLDHQERDKRVMSLIIAGASMVQIQEEFGLGNLQAARNMVEKAFVRNSPGARQVSFARNLMDARLQAMVRVAWERAMGIEHTAGGKVKRVAPDLKWFRELRETMRDIGRLYGTDAPMEHRHGQSASAGPVQVQNLTLDVNELASLSDDEFQQRFKLAGEAAASVARAASADPDADGDGAEAPGEGEDDAGDGGSVGDAPGLHPQGLPALPEAHASGGAYEGAGGDGDER